MHTTAAHNISCKIYKNDVAFGVDVNDVSNVYVAKVQDQAGINLVNGDKIQLWGCASGGDTLFVKNFRLCLDYALVSVNGITLVTSVIVSEAGITYTNSVV